MSPIDLLPRNITRPVDPQALRDTSTGSEAGEGGDLSQPSEGFESLLDGFAEQRQSGSGKTQTTELSDTLIQLEDSGAAAETNPDIAGAVFTLLEGFLPRAIPQSGSASTNGQEQPSDNASLLMLQDVQNAQDVPDAVGTLPSSRMLVSVQHQETHFRPVLEASEAQIATEAQAEPGSGVEKTQVLQLKDHAFNVPSSNGQKRSDNAAMKDMNAPLAAAPAPVEETAGLEEQIEIRTLPKVEISKSQSAENAHGADPQGLPPATLHRLANAVGADVRAMAAEASSRAQTPDGTSRNISFKASESALRILKLQLHPAELGAVTVKMRLAGDTLEMELHVEKEETAQLLRHDSEKLSSLLRGSGYRPDVISIQVADGMAQDRSSASRQADTSFQGQSFAQGGDSQGERSRNRDNSYAGARAEQHRNTGDDETLGSHNRGGVYL
ncbi:flagellar hook-length control protein FliK [Microvirga solisilvae]|uniref:flagellar hook-length control protein FliK n=1 Tax=Microvirga solisilvae TaxID=2919498 RepID=UPI001FAE94DE|nr:flagellar hook-length control protein FliK [Microvirga solisilvae]